jgi:hypothetical protein
MVTARGAIGKDDLMSDYELNRAIHHIYTDRALTTAFRKGEYAVLDGFDLTTDERRALEGRDFPTLWALHVHPVLLFHLSAVLNPREWYLENVVPKIKNVPNKFYDYYHPHDGEEAVKQG